MNPLNIMRQPAAASQTMYDEAFAEVPGVRARPPLATLGSRHARHLYALELDLANGERVLVFGRAELYEQRGELRLRALTIERVGLGAHLAALERREVTA